MDALECTYIYYKAGKEFITPSLEHALERTDQKIIKVKCEGDSKYRELIL